MLKFLAGQVLCTSLVLGTMKKHGIITYVFPLSFESNIVHRLDERYIISDDVNFMDLELLLFLSPISHKRRAILICAWKITIFGNVLDILCVNVQ